jgi:DNA-binding response OmpR family regulator
VDRVNDPARGTSERAESEEPGSRKQETMIVLVVQMEGPGRDAAVDSLRRVGHDVRCADNAFRAVSSLSDRPADVVLLNLGAFGERDLEVIPVLRDLSPGISVILVFSPAQRDLAARGLAMGADAYLPEPHYTEELLTLVQRPRAVRSEEATSLEASADLLWLLAADAAHEINNPLQIMQLLYDGQSERSDPGSDDVQPHIARLGAIGRLLADLGRLSQPASARSIDLAEVLRDARGRVAGAGDDPIRPVLPISGHAELIGETVQGLLRRAESDGDAVTSTCRDVDAHDGRWVEITVQGTGEHRTQRAESGSDPSAGPLFLTFCRIVVQVHGGRFAVDEADGEPTSYRILLPAGSSAEDE